MENQASFFWSNGITLLFSAWQTHSTTEYLLTLLFVFVLAMLYHWLTGFRAIQVARFNAVKDAPDKSDTLEAGSIITAVQKCSKMRKLLLAILFGINSGMGYLLMLCIMGFNVGVFVAVVLGLTVAYFFFD